MSLVADVRDTVPPSRATELLVVTATAALVVVAYRAYRRYRRWADETSLLAGPRARAAAFRTSYRRKRSSVAEVTAVIGEIVGAVVGDARPDGR